MPLDRLEQFVVLRSGQFGMEMNLCSIGRKPVNDLSSGT